MRYKPYLSDYHSSSPGGTAVTENTGYILTKPPDYHDHFAQDLRQTRAPMLPPAAATPSFEETKSMSPPFSAYSPPVTFGARTYNHEERSYSADTRYDLSSYSRPDYFEGANGGPGGVPRDLSIPRASPYVNQYNRGLITGYPGSTAAPPPPPGYCQGYYPPHPTAGYYSGYY